MAAVRLMESLSAEAVKPDWRRRFADAAACRRDSRLRVAARWVLNWLETGRDPRALAALWSKIVAEEDDQMLRHPRERRRRSLRGCCSFRSPPSARRRT